VSDRIIITGVSATGYHGVFPEERRDGQIFIVDAILHLDLSVSGANDHLINTVDYSVVARLIHETIEGEPFSLIEKLAEAIASKILAAFSLVRSVTITVHKPDAPVGVTVADIAVEIVRNR
jgi:dihydroneopterin aldolase